MQPTITYTPSKRIFMVLALLGAISLGCFTWDGLSVPWLVFLVVLMGAVGWDFVILMRCRMKLVASHWDHRPTVQRPFVFTLDLQPETAAHVRYTVRTIYSDVLIPSKETAHLENQGHGGVKAVMEIFPKRRGELAWPGVNIQFKSFLGLISKWQRIESQIIPVYPKLTRDLQNQFNPDFLMEQMGRKVNRYMRSDQDFESLRPYVPGDNYRHIDWKASARMQTWITRQYQVEHHHNILVCLDISRLMGTLTEGISKLDWAIEASLHLAYLASRFNDRMGLLVFSNDVERWVKPLNHPVEMFLSSVYNLEAKVVEADFHKVCMSIMAAQKKRSLVIFLSDFLDASSLEPSLEAFGHLNRRHCSLFIGIEDPAYKKYLETAEMHDGLDLSRKIIAQDSMQRRLAVLQQLQQMGLRSLTVSPENLVQRAMQAYMDIKLQGAI